MLEWLTRNQKGWAAVAATLWLLSVFACGFEAPAPFESTPGLSAAAGLLFVTAPDLCCHEGQHAPALESGRLSRTQVPPGIITTTPVPVAAVLALTLMVIAAHAIRAGPRARRSVYFQSIWPQAPPL